MQRDFSQELIGLGGQKLVEANGDEQRPMTLGAVSVNALMGQFADEQAITGEEKFRRYQLAERVSDAGVQDVSAEEIALIKRLIGKAYGPVLVGPAFKALELDPEQREPAVG